MILADFLFIFREYVYQIFQEILIDKKFSIDLLCIIHICAHT